MVYKKQCDMTYETVVDYEYEQKCTHSYEEECHGYGYHQECEKVTTLRPDFDSVKHIAQWTTPFLSMGS